MEILKKISWIQENWESFHFINEFSNYIVSEYDLHLREDDIDNLIKNRTLPSNLAAIQTKVLDTLDTMALQYLKRGIKTFYRR